MSENVAWILFMLGSMATLVGYLLRAPVPEEERRRARVLATPTKRIADAEGEGLVELRGKVVLDDESKAIVAPFSDRRAVWLRVDVTHVFDKTQTGAHTETQSISFLIDDGSGQRARVELDEKDEVMVDWDLLATQTTNETAPAKAMAYLAKKRVSSKNRWGNDAKMWFRESLIAVGDEIFVIGPSRREAMRPEDGYREEATTRLVVERGEGKGDEKEVLVTKLREPQLLSALRPYRTAGWIVLVLGALVGLYGASGVFARWLP
jgi:hypothetical protein